MRRHVVPVVIAPTVIQMSQILGIAIVVQAGLEFIGLGSANQASWGGMLSDAFQNIYAQPRLVLWPGLAIVLTVTACSLLGNALRDSLGISGRTPRVRRRSAATALGTAPVVADGDAAGQGSPAEPDALLELDGLRGAYPQAARRASAAGRAADDLRRRGPAGSVPERDEPDARSPDRLHPAGADVQPRPLVPDRLPAD